MKPCHKKGKDRPLGTQGTQSIDNDIDTSTDTDTDTDRPSPLPTGNIDETIDTQEGPKKEATNLIGAVSPQRLSYFLMKNFSKGFSLVDFRGHQPNI